MENTIISQFISSLMSARTQAHIYHLQTPSFAAHKALNEFYDEIVDTIDGLVESYQGKYGIVSGYSNVVLQEYQSCDGIIMYFTTLVTFIEKTRGMICQDSYIQNQVDELIALIYSLLYKLKYLK
jgi:DNA-binding ferritin-like protein